MGSSPRPSRSTELFAGGAIRSILVLTPTMTAGFGKEHGGLRYPDDGAGFGAGSSTFEMDVTGLVNGTGQWENMQQVVRSAIKALLDTQVNHQRQLQQMHALIVSSSRRLAKENASREELARAAAGCAENTSGLSELRAEISATREECRAEARDLRTKSESRVSREHLAACLESKANHSELVELRGRLGRIFSDVHTAEMRGREALKRKSQAMEKRLEALETSVRECETHAVRADPAAVALRIETIGSEVRGLGKRLDQKAEASAVERALQEKLGKQTLEAALASKADRADLSSIEASAASLLALSRERAAASASSEHDLRSVSTETADLRQRVDGFDKVLERLERGVAEEGKDCRVALEKRARGLEKRVVRAEEELGVAVSEVGARVEEATRRFREQGKAERKSVAGIVKALAKRVEECDPARQAAAVCTALDHRMSAFETAATAVTMEAKVLQAHVEESTDRRLVSLEQMCLDQDGKIAALSRFLAKRPERRDVRQPEGQQHRANARIMGAMPSDTSGTQGATARTSECDNFTRGGGKSPSCMTVKPGFPTTARKKVQGGSCEAGQKENCRRHRRRAHGTGNGSNDEEAFSAESTRDSTPRQRSERVTRRDRGGTDPRGNAAPVYGKDNIINRCSAFSAGDVEKSSPGLVGDTKKEFVHAEEREKQIVSTANTRRAQERSSKREDDRWDGQNGTGGGGAEGGEIFSSSPEGHSQVVVSVDEDHEYSRDVVDELSPCRVRGPCRHKGGEGGRARERCQNSSYVSGDSCSSGGRNTVSAGSSCSCSRSSCTRRARSATATAEEAHHDDSCCDGGEPLSRPPQRRSYSGGRRSGAAITSVFLTVASPTRTTLSSSSSPVGTSIPAAGRGRECDRWDDAVAQDKRGRSGPSLSHKTQQRRHGKRLAENRQEGHVDDGGVVKRSVAWPVAHHDEAQPRSSAKIGRQAEDSSSSSSSRREIRTDVSTDNRCVRGCENRRSERSVTDKNGEDQVVAGGIRDGGRVNNSGGQRRRGAYTTADEIESRPTREDHEIDGSYDSDGDRPAVGRIRRLEELRKEKEALRAIVARDK